MRQLGFVINRLGFALLTIFVSVLLNFMLFRLIPGDAVSALRCSQCSPEFKEYLRQSLGLDQPVLTQFWLYLTSLLQGDMGRSLRTGRSVSDMVGEGLANSVPLVALALALALVIGTLTGLISAWRQGRPVDRLGTWTALTFNSLPPQWLGLLVVLYVAKLFGLPASGISDPSLGILGDESPWTLAVDRFEHMILPALTLSLVMYGSFALVTRSAMLDTLGQDYIMTARAKGLGSFEIIRRHAFHNSLLPLVTMWAMAIGFMVGGAVTIEYVFSYSGIGLLMVDVIGQRDWPVLQGAFLVTTISVVVANVAADLINLRLDPRVRT